MAKNSKTATNAAATNAAATNDADTTKKAVCPISADQFQAQAQALEVTINGVKLLAEVKLFSTGSYGWYCSGKVNVKFGDKVVPVQCGMNMICVGSKPQ